MLVGTRVLARREDDLEAEEGIIKKLHSVGGATVANVRLLDGYMVPNVPVEELVAVSWVSKLVSAAHGCYTRCRGRSRGYERVDGQHESELCSLV